MPLHCARHLAEELLSLGDGQAASQPGAEDAGKAQRSKCGEVDIRH
jgi:hypothetical protein